MNNNLTVFDLDHTLIPIDSDYEWGEFICRIGAVDSATYAQCNANFYADYQAGRLDSKAYLEFVFETLSRFSTAQLAAMRQQFMQEVIQPALLPAARQLIEQHQGDLIIMITATNRFITEPIAQAFGIEHLIAAEPEMTPDGRLTGKLIGSPTLGAGKVEHLRTWLAQRHVVISDFERSYFYSDSHNDLPLLKLVSHPIATNPDALLMAQAKLNGWTILNIFNLNSSVDRL